MDDFSYGGDPTANKKDAIRYMLGDTDADGALISDSEIAFELANEGQIFSAAANCCDVIAIKFARVINRTSKTTNLNQGSGRGLHELWIQRADALRYRASSHVGPVFASDFIAGEVASGCYTHLFDIGMDDNKYIP